MNLEIKAHDNTIKIISSNEPDKKISRILVDDKEVPHWDKFKLENEVSRSNLPRFGQPKYYITVLWLNEIYIQFYPRPHKDMKGEVIYE